jgi:cobalt/nickel transport system permease protein
MGASLFAVHLSDGAVSAPWLVGGFAVAAGLLVVAAWRMTEEWVPRVGVLTAAFFVGSLIHFKSGPASVHLLLNGLVGVMLGRRAPLAVAVGLANQFLMFSHGGLTTLGLNTCIIAVPALAAGAVFPLLRATGLPPFVVGVLIGVGTAAATVAGDFAVLILGGTDDFSTLAKILLIPNSLVVVVEGLIVGVVVQYLAKVRPEMLGGRA